MNYCSLEDAWGGKCNQISNQYKNYMTENNYTQPTQQNTNINTPIQKTFSEKNNKVETFDNTLKQHITQTTKLTKNDDHHLDELYDCDSFLNHVRNCRKCHNKMRTFFKPKIIENFQDIIEDNRDTIVLILIGISILLFFNLINNMTKSN